MGYNKNMDDRKIKDDVLSYREMCDLENVQTLQRGMNYRLNPAYSVFLMSQRSNAPYNDKVRGDGITIEYEGHDTIKRGYGHNPKLENQPDYLPSGKHTQNGLFLKAVNGYKEGTREPEGVKIYEKVIPGIWSLKGYFNLVDYKLHNDGNRSVFRFVLTSSNKNNDDLGNIDKELKFNRVIPSHVKLEVWKRDQGKCVICGETKNLHFDHDLPFSKGGTSLTAKNVRLLCMKHNLEKSDTIE